MKTKQLLTSLVLLALSGSFMAAAPLGTAFTYQGRLQEGSQAAHGSYQLKFTIHDAAASGSVVAGPITNAPVTVSNGLFTVRLDFGANVFAGNDRWLEIGVRANGSAEDFTLLAPRQPLTATPYALHATEAGVAATAGAVAAGSINNAALAVGAVDSNRIADGSVGAGDLAPALLSSTFWRMDGNAGTTAGTHFVGTTDYQPLELRVQGRRGLRLEPGLFDSVNVIGGYAGNVVVSLASGATIAGGGVSYGWFDYTNRVESDLATIGGGGNNIIKSGSDGAVISGGMDSAVGNDARQATIAGGWGNSIQNGARGAAIGGGRINTIGTNSSYATIAGGVDNNIHDRTASSAIGGGTNNVISISSLGATIAGGMRNSIGSNSTGGIVGGGEYNKINRNADYSTIVGGNDNDIGDASVTSFIGGGWNNSIGTNSPSSTISGGSANVIAANARYATIVGGAANFAGDSYAFAAGHRAYATHAGSFVWADSSSPAFSSTKSNEVSFRCSGGMRLETDRGIALNASDAPIITRAFDPFTANAGADKAGLGRWGLFMEPMRLCLGMPTMAGRYVAISRFDTNGTRTDLMSVNQSGTVTATAFNPTSDRNAKENFEGVDSRAVLEKVAALPISKWNFKGATETPHVGPMAQDFHAAFGLGTDDKHIATVDADGIALAAIQGLNRKLEEKNAALEKEVLELKSLVKSLAEKVNWGGQ